MKSQALSASLCLILAMGALITVMSSAAASTTAQTILSLQGTIVYPQQLYSYIVYQQSSTYYAENGTTRQICWSSTNASYVINQAVTNGRSVYISPGFYPLTAAILPTNSSQITGSGYGTELYMAGTYVESNGWVNNVTGVPATELSSDIFCLGDNPSMSSISNVQISNMRLVGGLEGIETLLTSDSTFSNLWIEKSAFGILLISNTNLCTVSNVIFNETYDYCIEVYNSNDNTVSNCYSCNCSTLTADFMARQGYQNRFINDSSVNSMAHGFEFQDGENGSSFVGGSVEHSALSGVVFQAQNATGNSGDHSDGCVTDCSITGTIIQNCGYAGGAAGVAVENQPADSNLINCTGISIVGVTVFNCGFGVTVDPYCFGTLIDGSCNLAGNPYGAVQDYGNGTIIDDPV